MCPIETPEGPNIGLISDNERYNKTIDIWQKTTDKVSKAPVSYTHLQDRPGDAGRKQSCCNVRR